MGSLLVYLSGKLEDVFVHELDGVVAAFKIFIGLMSRPYLPLVWEGSLDPGTGLAGNKRNGQPVKLISRGPWFLLCCSASIFKF